MYFDEEDDRDVFEAFGVADAETDDVVLDNFEPALEAPVETAPAVIEPERPVKVKTGFSWAGFAGGLAALVWIAGAIGGPLSYFGVEAVMAMDPAMQAGLNALAFGPALLFWVTASAAGEALKARKLAMQLALSARAPSFPSEAAEREAQRLTNTVKNEIDSLNDAVAAALDRLSQLETAAHRNAILFSEAVEASRENTASMSHALKAERDALMELNGDLKGQTDVMAHSVGRQIRLMREASKLVKTEISAAEDALETHLASFAASATVMGERTAAFHLAADGAAAATASLNGAMGEMLSGLSEATRLTETAKKSTEQAVLAANETASAVRETTRSAVFEAKRAAQLIRAEAAAMQEAANDTMAKLQDAAEAARSASDESQAAADRHAASIEKRLGALAVAAGAKKAASGPRLSEAKAVEAKAVQAKVAEARAMETWTVEAKPEPVVEEEVTSLRAAANAAVMRGTARAPVEVQQRRMFKGFGVWGNFMPHREEPLPVAANEDAFALAEFGSSEPVNADAQIKSGALDLVTDAGVDLEDVLHAGDLERIARCSRDGASARRRAVVDAAPGAVTRIARHVKRHSNAQDLASQFRSRPDLAKSESKREGGELVRAYLLIDAALA
jgi:hypothetical protein